MGTGLFVHFIDILGTGLDLFYKLTPIPKVVLKWKIDLSPFSIS